MGCTSTKIDHTLLETIEALALVSLDLALQMIEALLKEKIKDIAPEQLRILKTRLELQRDLPTSRLVAVNKINV